MYERALAGGRRTQEEVAVEFGVTRAAVCQYLTIVRRLPADMVDAVEGEREPSRLRILSMKRLVGIARLATDGARRRAMAALMTGQVQGGEGKGRAVDITPKLGQ